MRRLAACTVCAVLLAGGSLYADDAVADAYSADAYTACAACHLADGAGIPGAFPPINNRVAAIAGLQGGREFLMTAVSFGLMGTIEAGGAQFAGIMPGNKGLMSAEDIAAALNYVIFELADDQDKIADVKPVTADEVEDLQSRVSAGGPAIASELRKQLVEKNGERWPG
jgi:hypothetical protein